MCWGQGQPGHRLQRFDQQLFSRIGCTVSRDQRHRITDTVDESGEHHPVGRLRPGSADLGGRMAE